MKKVLLVIVGLALIAGISAAQPHPNGYATGQISFHSTDGAVTEVRIVTGSGLNVAEAGGVVTITLDGGGTTANAIVTAVTNTGIANFSAELFTQNQAVLPICPGCLKTSGMVIKVAACSQPEVSHVSHHCLKSGAADTEFGSNTPVSGRDK